MRASIVLARAGAGAILRAYESYKRRFQEITARASWHFESRDWSGGQRDVADRLALYRVAVEGVSSELAGLLGQELRDEILWRTMKPVFTEFIAHLPDLEIAGTFYNSVTRKVLTTVGVDPQLEFIDLDMRRAHLGAGSTIHRHLPRRASTRELVLEALASLPFAARLRDPVSDAAWVAERIDAAWERGGQAVHLEALDLIEPIFYRGSGAYLVGRLRGGETVLPFALVLLHRPQGIEADAVLLTERELSIVFSFTRSHFLVSLERPADVILFLHSIMPRKPLAELYIALGYTKHGKTEMYQDLLGHLQRSMGLFELSRGEPGMVMVVFDLRSYDYVFKVIRDRFAAPKTNTRADVKDRYRLVFEHDRAGRLIEAQEFEHLTFERRRFSERLLQELERSAAGSVSIDAEQVHIRHLYIERRVHPLNLFLREVGPQEAEQVVLDYGQAIRDLATTNIFPGDFLLKNFGVTRHGRVVFYDYDELSLVTECTFLDLPTPQNAEQELSSEPWFYVGEHDVFPEEFLNFLGLSPEHRRLFLAAHGDLLRAGFWRQIQARHRAGEVLEVLPYSAARLSVEAG
jgi:isocitrate dehydrogenase kinase/phosphatase